jgi:hypothetical protein
VSRGLELRKAAGPKLVCAGAASRYAEVTDMDNESHRSLVQLGEQIFKPWLVLRTIAKTTDDGESKPSTRRVLYRERFTVLGCARAEKKGQEDRTQNEALRHRSSPFRGK